MPTHTTNADLHTALQALTGKIHELDLSVRQLAENQDHHAAQWQVEGDAIAAANHHRRTARKWRDVLVFALEQMSTERSAADQAMLQEVRDSLAGDVDPIDTAELMDRLARRDPNGAPVTSRL